MRKLNAVIESTTAPMDTNVLWINGLVARHFTNGEWIELCPFKSDIIELTVGDTANIKASNLKALGQKEHISYAKVNGGYGFGSVYWTMPAGGTVYTGLLCSVNPAGSTIYYNISSEGAITQIVESYDLYKYYCEKTIEAGNTPMDNETFMNHLLEMI